MLNIQTLFNKILHGDFGLVKSFWIYGILSSYLLILLLMPLLIYFNSTLLSIIFSLTIVTYIAIQIIGIWRASLILISSRSAISPVLITGCSTPGFNT